MFVIGNVLLGLAKVLDMVLWLYTIVLIGRAVVSWVDANPYNPIVRVLVGATEPLLPRSLRYFPIDVAFLVLFGLVYFARIAVVQTLVDIAVRMR